MKKNNISEIILNYFKKENMINGIRSCEFKYKLPLLIILFLSMATFATEPSLIAKVVSASFFFVDVTLLGTIKG